MAVHVGMNHLAHHQRPVHTMVLFQILIRLIEVDQRHRHLFGDIASRLSILCEPLGWPSLVCVNVARRAEHDLGPGRAATFDDLDHILPKPIEIITSTVVHPKHHHDQVRLAFDHIPLHSGQALTRSMATNAGIDHLNFGLGINFLQSFAQHVAPRTTTARVIVDARDAVAKSHDPNRLLARLKHGDGPFGAKDIGIQGGSKTQKHGSKRHGSGKRGSQISHDVNSLGV